MVKIVYKIASRGICETDTRTVIKAGRHSFRIDEPIERHGTDHGATPLEYLLASFVGCTNVIANKLAKEIGIKLVDMVVFAEVDLDGSVLQGVDVPTAFPELRLKIDVKSNAKSEDINCLKTLLAKKCPVSVLFRQSGTTVVEEWNIQPI